MHYIHVVSRQDHRVLSVDALTQLTQAGTELSGFQVGDVISLDLRIRDLNSWRRLMKQELIPGFERFPDEQQPEGASSILNKITLQFTAVRRILSFCQSWQVTGETGLRNYQMVLEIEPISEVIEQIYTDVLDISREAIREEIQSYYEATQEEHRALDDNETIPF